MNICISEHDLSLITCYGLASIWYILRIPIQADVWLYWGWLPLDDVVEEIKKAGPWWVGHSAEIGLEGMKKTGYSG